MPILLKIFPKIAEENFQIHSMRPLSPWYKTDKDTTKIKDYRPISLMNIDAKILNKILANRIQQHIKRDTHTSRSSQVYPKDARIFQCMQINQCDISFCCIVQLLYHVQLFVTPWTAALHASLSLTISQSLLKFLSIESVMPSSHLILCCPHLLLSSIFPNISLFQWVSCLHLEAKVLELQLQHQSFQWIFRTDFL